MPTLEIDCRSLTVEDGLNVVQAASASGWVIGETMIGKVRNGGFARYVRA